MTDKFTHIPAAYEIVSLEYIDEIKGNLKEDLKRRYPDIDFRENGSVREDLQRIFAEKKERFVFVFDEWDSVFHMPFVTEDDK